MRGYTTLGRLIGRALIVAFVTSMGTAPAFAGNDLESLKTVEVPKPDNLGDFIKDEAAAIALGKALFWDVQSSSDGRVACATCHFVAGIDQRTFNTVNPGPNGMFEIVAGPNDTVTAGVFPFGRDPAIDDIIGSQGVAPRVFTAVHPGVAEEDCVGDVNGTRQVTGRNTPTMNSSIFNEFNFWDGRANVVFNGVNPAGDNDPTATILVDDGAGLMAEMVVIEPASQASQSVGPPRSDVEMICAGRTFADLGRKMVPMEPLAGQDVAVDDSVLAGLRDGDGKGLATTYEDMIKAAFHDRYWDSAATTAEGFSLMEANFPLFWGLAIELYGTTLIPDDSPFDRFMDGTGSLATQELKGMDVFQDDGRCVKCHHGAEFTNASIQNGGNGRQFANTVVRPVAEDPGRENGEFKSSTLRNIELTGPYFHNGGYLTLRQVVEFYNRGGDFPNDETDSQIRRLRLDDNELDALVAFMLTLTDDRVRTRSAPFDGPQLAVPNGPTIPATGTSGGAPIGTYLGADPFSP